MKKLFLLVALLTSQVLCWGQHYQAFKSPKQLHQFFKYSPSKFYIAGHRGSVENGLPENSIEGMEAVLQTTWAFFEIDPRLSKDSVVVLMHDATLDRTTNGKGKVSDYTFAELQQLFLKDKDGNLTPYKIPTLEAVIRWAKGKTVLNLDQKDVPVEITSKMVKDLNADSYVMMTVHSPEQAWFYLKQNPNQMLSAHIQTEEKLRGYEAAKVPFNRMIAYIGSSFKENNATLIAQLKAKGVMCMMAGSPAFDKIKEQDERHATFRKVKEIGVTLFESDIPMDVAKAIK